MEKWMVMAKRADFIEIGKKFGIDKVTARIIRNLDVICDNDINMYINGGIDDLYDPKLLKDSDKLIDILTEKIKQKKLINQESRILRFELFHNGLYKQKVIPNKKKDVKKYNWKKDMTDYLNIKKFILVFK